MTSRRITLALLAFVAGVLPLSAAQPSSHKPTVQVFEVPFPASDDNREITRASVVAQMNTYRDEHGLPPLVENQQLDGAADDRMGDMEDGAYWSHQSPDGRSPFTYLGPRGYAFMRAGENLATGFDSVQLLVAAWMESPGHRANILSPAFRDCGVAIIDGATTGPASGKSIVVLYATPR
jgi:uncharacterized protein YkwD